MGITRISFCAAILAMAASAPLVSEKAWAQSFAAMSCDQLWYARNAIYAAKGYCFKTDRAKSVFGPRCYPPYGKLSVADSNNVQQIKQWEARKGCTAAGTAPARVPAPGYQSMNCSQLWHARNAIYAAKGYCFKTDRAKAVFGPGCYPPYGQLSAGEQAQVAAISAAERTKGCR